MDRGSPVPPLDHARIRELIPHAGRMCLLDRATHWDAHRICCVATSHLAPDNPLRRDGRLAAVCGIEYAAQAMALHGALLQGTNACRPGFLVSVRDVRCGAAVLDAGQAPLEVEALRLMGTGTNVMYEFVLRAAGEVLLSGRAAVVLG